jgi:hypothetical protein
MTTEQADAESRRLKELLSYYQSVECERNFLARVLRQAVMTHGGVLRVDPDHAERARPDWPLEMGGGQVRLVDEVTARTTHPHLFRDDG